MKNSMKERNRLIREFSKVAKSASRTCWDTGQPYNGLGCFLLYRQRTIARK